MTREHRYLMTGLFERIMVATDGSEKNQHAVEKALEIARACRSTVFAVYVIDETMLSSSPADVSLEAVYSTLKSEGDQAVKRVKDMAKDVAVEEAVLSGKAAREIVSFAAKQKIDLIVIGTQGKTGLQRLLLGSVAESVIRTADCPVLVVKSS